MKVDKLNSNNTKFLVTIFIIFGILTFGLRAYLNFRQELVPGVNGGYYPLQVRYILTNGILGFSDMPLLFYLDALLLKIISLFGVSITDQLILWVVKIVDSISIPLLLIPLFNILKLEKHSYSTLFVISIVSFSVLSIEPLILISDLQKNALAITFIFFFISYILSFLKNKIKFDLILSIVFLILLGLTHFGTFIFGLLFAFLIIGATYRRNAIIPISISIILSVVIIFIFDKSRFYRLFSFGSFLFEKPAITNGMLTPPDYLVLLFSIILAIVSIYILIKKNSKLLGYQKASLLSSIICILILSNPYYDIEYLKRLMLFLFIPQTLIILYFSSIVTTKQIKVISALTFVFTLLSIFNAIAQPKETVIDINAYKDLQRIKSVIKNDNQTIIIARHGLEWWVAWVLETKVGQDKSINQDLSQKYKNVIIINQLNGFSYERRMTHFHEPLILNNSEKIYSSKYFVVYKINKII